MPFVSVIFLESQAIVELLKHSRLDLPTMLDLQLLVLPATEISTRLPPTLEFDETLPAIVIEHPSLASPCPSLTSTYLLVPLDPVLIDSADAITFPPVLLFPCPASTSACASITIRRITMFHVQAFT